jgi:flagellar basal body-associated protein FliL
MTVAAEPTASQAHTKQVPCQRIIVLILYIYIYIFLVTFLKIYATDVRKKKTENGNGEKIEVAMSAQYRLNLPIVADERKVCLYSL